MSGKNHWQFNKSISESMHYMRVNNILCDVTFVVGTSEDHIRAHKLVMIGRSPVFYSMFEGPLAETDVILVPDIEKDSFEAFLKFLYTDKVDISSDIAESLLYAANKYMIDELTTCCIHYYLDVISPENACVLLDEACFYDIPKLKKMTLRYICENADTCLKSESFTFTSQDGVKLITECEDLFLEEERIFEAVIRWADTECMRQSLEITDLSRREALGKIVYDIHFPAIKKQYFHDKILHCNILSKEEKQWIESCYRMYQEASEKDQFKITDRTYRPKEYENVFRLLNPISYSWCPSGSVEAISVDFSRPVWLHGLLLYGHFASSAETNYAFVHVHIKDSDNDAIAITQKGKIIENEDNLNNVLLDLPIRLKSGERYTLQVCMEGHFISWGGSDGQSAVQFLDCEIRFFNCPDPETRTNVKEGQIPGLLLSL